MYDYHVHSHFSADSKMTFDAACDAAIHNNVKEIAFTDHIDFFYPNCDLTFEFNYDDYAKAIDEVRQRYSRKITILKAVEVGLHPSQIDRNRSFVTDNEFDFIIGSVHIADHLDLHNGDYFKGKTANEAIENYFLAINENVKQYTHFNVLGHLTLIKRYLHYANCQWQDVNWRKYYDMIEDTFKTLISTGRGIEVNMSGFRYRIDCALPDLSFIKLYHELGGEIITVGTDAHSKEFVGKHLDLGYELLKQAGFRFVTTFRQQKPSFVTIPQEKRKRLG